MTRDIKANDIIPSAKYGCFIGLTKNPITHAIVLNDKLIATCLSIFFI